MTLQDLPATIRQKQAIGKLLRALQVREEYEQVHMSREEARYFIFYLRGELRAKYRKPRR